MQDRERRRPLRRPIRRQKEPGVSNEDYDEEYDSDDEVALPPALPEHRLRFALLAGALTGIVMIATHFLIPFLNVAAFQKAAASASLRACSQGPCSTSAST